MEAQDFPKTLEQIDSHLLAFTAERRRAELLEACERTVGPWSSSPRRLGKI